MYVTGERYGTVDVVSANKKLVQHGSFGVAHCGVEFSSDGIRLDGHNRVARGPLVTN